MEKLSLFRAIATNILKGATVIGINVLIGMLIIGIIKIIGIGLNSVDITRIKRDVSDFVI